MIKNLKIKFDNYICNIDDIRKPLLIILIFGVVAGDIISSIALLINGGQGMITNILLLIASIFSLYLCVKKDKTNVAANMLIPIALFIIMPIMFFMEGGNNSGMPIWFLFSITIAILMLEGWAKYLFPTLAVLIEAICMMVGHYYPDTVKDFPDSETVFTDMLQSYVFTSVIMALLLIIYIAVFKRQRTQLKEQQKELEKALEQVKQADMAKSTFLASMSHEIRTPINAVIGMNELILRESNEKDILGYANNIQTSSQALLSLISDILDFSKIESGKMDIICVDYELAHFLNDINNIIYKRFEDKKLKFEIKANPKIPNLLYGDEVHVKQIIINLLTNAVKYTNEGSVTLAIDFEKQSEDYINLIASVTDTGMGIKQENLEKLFNSFQRLDQVKNRTIEGTGLGLAITKNFVELMDGNISVTSEYGKGSTFTVAIPQKIRSEKEMGEFAPTVSMKKSEYSPSFVAPEARILVVDDVVMNLKVFKGLLKKTQVQIDTAESGMECLELVRRNKYNLIFLDHMMPEMDGIETLEKMKEMSNYPNTDTPVVMLTANAISGAKNNYLEAGFSAYLSKPVNYRDLENMLKEYI